MARIGETLFRFTGAVLLGVSATAIDNPQVLDAPQTSSEAIVAGRPASEGTGAGFEVGITQGKRAYAIRINDIAALPGLIRPNSRVDIMVVIYDPAQGKQVAKMFMSNMRVLAIGAAPERAVDGRPISAGVASIEVTPDEAERLAIAASQGSLQLVLRGYGDPDSVRSATGSQCGPANRGVVRDALLRSCASPPPPPVVVPRKPVRPDSFALKIFRGVMKREAPEFAKDSAARAGSARP